MAELGLEYRFSDSMFSVISTATCSRFRGKYKLGSFATIFYVCSLTSNLIEGNDSESIKRDCLIFKKILVL